MSSILVVDDERNIREDIVRILQDRFKENLEVYQAGNGQEAVELICAIHIDVIIADVKMPLCDGIEMMRRLGELGIRGNIIILSGFDDYAFVREAMKLGALDYLLKPVAIEDLTALVKKCLASIAFNGGSLLHRHDSGQDREDRFLLEQQFHFKRLLAGALPPDPAVRVAGERQLLLLALDVPEDRPFCFLEIQRLATDCFGEKPFRLLQGEYAGFWGAAFLSDRESLARAEEKLSRYFETVAKRYSLSSAGSPSHAAQAWQEAVHNLAKQFYDLPLESDPEAYYPFEELQQNIVTAICAYSVRDLNRLLLRLFGLLKYRKVPVEQARQVLGGLVYRVMSADSGFIGIIGRYKFKEMDVAPIVQDALSASRMLRGMMEAFSLYIQERIRLQRESKSAEGEGYTVQRIKHFIETHYQKRITLGMISLKLELHPNYLSTLFKQKTGTTYGNYLRFVRIEKAKVLIKTTNLKLYNVADMVGYKDSSHFYRAFKDETGVSPIEYRNSQAP